MCLEHLQLNLGKKRNYFMDQERHFYSLSNKEKKLYHIIGQEKTLIFNIVAMMDWL